MFLFLSLFFLIPKFAEAEEYLRYDKSSKLSSKDYLYESRSSKQEDVFDSATSTIDLGVDLGIGSDCGRVDFKNTLRSSLTNILNSEYFGDLGKNIVGSSPMLAACYFSPTWCAILKHSQLSANFMSQMRLNQCALIDKYTDSRTDDFYQERQTCVRRKIAENGGNLESAMGSCQNVYQSDLASWKEAGQSRTNKLIDSSAAWAGFRGEPAKKSLDLLKSMVGDTVISNGQVKVDYGPKAVNLSPNNHLLGLEKSIHTKLCTEVLTKIKRQHGRPVERIISDADLKSLGDGTDDFQISRETLESLALMPARKQNLYCKKLSDALALGIFTKDLNRSLDILTASTQNPHLPPNRKQELDDKRRQLKESVELTLTLKKERSDPLNSVLSQINASGNDIRGEIVREKFDQDDAALRNERVKSQLLDCADGLNCPPRRP